MFKTDGPTFHERVHYQPIGPHIKELMNESGLETIPVEMSHLESGDPGESEMTTVSHLLFGPPPTDS